MAKSLCIARTATVRTSHTPTPALDLLSCLIDDAVMRAIVVLCGLAAGCAGTRHLDPPPQPALVMPPVAVPPTPPPPGVARVIFDVVDGPAIVHVKQATPTSTTWVQACVTPCVTDLVAGAQEVSFQMRDDPSHGDYTTVNVPAGTSLYRRALGGYTTHPGLLIGGYIVGYTGLTTLLFSSLIYLINGSSGGVGNVVLFSLGMTVAGGAMFYAGWPSDQQGSVTQYAFPPR